MMTLQRDTTFAGIQRMELTGHNKGGKSQSKITAAVVFRHYKANATWEKV